MINVLMVPPFSSGDEANLADMEGLKIEFSASPSDEQLANAEIILGQPAVAQLEKARSLKLLQITSAGSDRYNAAPQLFKNGAKLANLSGAFGQSISEYMLAMVLSLYKGLPLYRDNQRDHAWKDEGRQYSPRGRNVLILGAGNIGSDAAKLFKAFGCTITGLCRSQRPASGDFDKLITLDALDAELPEADIVLCALPGTPATYKLLDARRLSLLKPSAVIVNCGRGSLIDCEALADRLSRGLIYGAGLDVTDPEPLPPEHPLWDCRNCIITPHASGGTFGHLKETEYKMYDIIRENLNRYISGKPLLNLVDFEAGYRQTENRY